MKKQLCFLLMVAFTAFSLTACGEEGSKASDVVETTTIVPFAKGADISWLPEMEADSVNSL